MLIECMDLELLTRVGLHIYAGMLKLECVSFTCTLAGQNMTLIEMTSYINLLSFHMYTGNLLSPEAVVGNLVFTKAEEALFTKVIQRGT